MPPRTAVALASLACVAAGCGGQEEPTLAFSCTESEQAIAAALRAAPAQVRLPDGTRISDCVRGADDDGEQQQFGVLLVAVGDRLAPRAARDPREAERLGYLLGAAREGASRVNGIIDELVFRLAASGRALAGAPVAVRDAYLRGQAAGRRLG